MSASLSAINQATAHSGSHPADKHEPLLDPAAQQASDSDSASTPLVPSTSAQLSLREYLLVIGVLLLCQTIWATYAVWIKNVLTQMPAEVFSCYRDSLAVPCLLAAAWWKEGCGAALLRRANWRHLLFVCVCGVCLFMNKLCAVLGIQAANPTAASMMQPLIPAWTTVLSIGLALDHSAPLRALIQQRKQAAAVVLHSGVRMSSCTRLLAWCEAHLPLLRLGGILGVLVSLSGAMVILVSAMRRDVSHQKNPMLGLAFFATNTFSMAAFVVVQKWAFRPTAVKQDAEQEQQEHERTREAPSPTAVCSPAGSPSLPEESAVWRGEHVKLRALSSAHEQPLLSPVDGGSSSTSSLTARHTSRGYSAIDDGGVKVSASDSSSSSSPAPTAVPPLSEWLKYPITLTALCYIVCAFCMLLSSLPYIRVAIREDDWARQFQPPRSVLGALAFGGIVSSAMSFALLCYATTKVPPPLVTAFWPIQIPMVAVGSWFVYGDRITPIQAAGGSVIVLGMAILVAVNMRTYRMEKEAAAQVAAAALHASPDPVAVKTEVLSK